MHCSYGMTFRGIPTSWSMSSEVVWMLEDLRYTEGAWAGSVLPGEEREEVAGI